MKKLIAILVVFAVFAGAAFAQDGSWTLSGNGKVETTTGSLNPGSNTPGNEGEFKLGYERGIFTTALKFNPISGEVGAELNVGDSDFNFSASISNIFDGGGGINGDFTIGDFYVKGSTGGIDPEWKLIDPIAGDLLQGGDGILLFKATPKAIEGLVFGFVTPGLFVNGTYDILETTYGVKYSSDFFGFALHFKYPSINLQATVLSFVELDFYIPAFGPFTVNLGTKVKSGDIALGEGIKLSAELIFKGLNNFGTINLGANVNFTYSASPFEAGIGVKFASGPNFNALTLTLEPYAHYDITPEYLRLRLGTKFGIPLSGGGAIDFEVKPGLYYSLRGEGFGDLSLSGDGVKMGIVAEYILGGTFSSAPTHAVHVGLRWDF